MTKESNRQGMLNYILTVSAGIVSTAIMVIGGYLTSTKKLDAETMQKLAIMVVGISAVLYIFINRFVSLRSKSRKPALIGIIPLIAAFVVTLNPALIMFGMTYAMIVLLAGWKLAEKKNPIVFFKRNGNIEDSKYQIPHCKHCGKPIRSLFQIRCSGCGKLRFK